MKVIHSFDRQTGKAGLIEVDDDATCTIPSCQGLNLQARPAVVVITNILPLGVPLIGSHIKASTIYLCEVHLNETGEAEADSFADLQRVRPL